MVILVLVGIPGVEGGGGAGSGDGGELASRGEVGVLMLIVC